MLTEFPQNGIHISHLYAYSRLFVKLFDVAANFFKIKKSLKI